VCVCVCVWVCVGVGVGGEGGMHVRSSQPSVPHITCIITYSHVSFDRAVQPVLQVPTKGNIPISSINHSADSHLWDGGAFVFIGT